MKKVVVIYDGTGQIQNTRYDLDEAPSVFSIAIEQEDGQYLDSFLIDREKHIPVIKEVELSIESQMQAKITSLEAQVLYLSMVNNGGIPNE